MAKCNSCGVIYHFLIDHNGKIIPVNETSMNINEVSAIIGKMEVSFNPSNHVKHTLTCKNNLKIDKRKSTITNKGIKQDGRTISSNDQQQLDF